MTVIDEYVAELDAALRGPRRAKADLLTEARDGLVDAAEAYRNGGLDPETAERQAVADFGELDEIVPAYQTELGLTQGRRTVLLVLFLFAAQPFAWGSRSAGQPAPRSMIRRPATPFWTTSWSRSAA